MRAFYQRKKSFFFPLNPSESQESLEQSERRRERWQQKQPRRRRRLRQRSISREKWVETLVVADTKMVEFHGSDNIEKYVLTVMNMVSAGPCRAGPWWFRHSWSPGVLWVLGRHSGLIQGHLPWWLLPSVGRGTWPPREVAERTAESQVVWSPLGMRGALLVPPSS